MAVRWNGDKFLKELHGQLASNVEAACIHSVACIKKKVDVAEPYVRYVGVNGVYYHGLDPSKPGEPPKKIRGVLQRGNTYKTDKKNLTGKVGSPLDQAVWQEFGTSKMEPRPHIRSTINQEQVAIRNLLGRGIDR